MPTGYRSPPAPRLAVTLGISPATARTLRAVLRGEMDPETASPATAAWVRQCWHRPLPKAVIRHAADALVGTCGVELVTAHSGKVLFRYLNSGDTYSPTLVFLGQSAVVSTLGDEVERLERNGVRVD